MTLSLLELIGFGPHGWGLPLLTAAGITLGAAISGFALGSFLGIIGATLKLSPSKIFCVLRVHFIRQCSAVSRRS